jgi:chromosome partitioning protein
MKTLAIISGKGGAGKTTLAVHLAVHANTRKRKVGIVDADPQGSASHWYRLRDAPEPPLKQLVAGELMKFQAQVEDVDMLVVDSAPAHSADMRAIVTAADFVLIPCRPGR